MRSMENQIIYAFGNGPKATRFLNYLKSGEVPGVKGSLCNGGLSVKARYAMAGVDGFDTTCQQLDDLADSLGGVEAS